MVLLPLSLILSVLGGALWCGLAAWLKNRFNANEVITTLMLNYIATYFLAFLVYGPMMDPDGGGFPQSKVLPDVYHLPLFSAQMRIHGGIVVAVIVILMMFFFWRTKLGVKIDLIGQGDKIATYAGVNVKKTVMVAMLISGALCGLAGWNEVYGVQYRLLEGLSSGYGDIATIIALLGGLNPLGIVIASFFFSALLPFQKPFSALVIQPGRGFLSFPHPPLCTSTNRDCLTRKSTERECPPVVEQALLVNAT